MNFLEEVKQYTPEDEEEKADKESFIQFLEAFGDKAFDRSCLPGHLAASIWVVNPERTKVLMNYHNLYKSFAWFGGHADGEKDLLKVAMKEFTEECGIKNFKALNNGKFINLNVDSVYPHIKRGVQTPCHLHYSVLYVFEADEKEPLQIAAGENSDLQWIKNEDVMSVVEEEHMKPTYARAMRKVKNL